MQKLCFSNVWEDSRIEHYYCKSTNKMLMIGSGGETLIDLLPINMYIDVIDSNILQIALCVFKILILYGINNNLDFSKVIGCNIPKNKLYMHIVTGQCSDYNKLIDLFNEEYKDLPYIKYINVWKEHIELLNNGVIFQGELEKTFKNLIKSNMNFESNFNNNNLVNKFGNCAIALSNDFSVRFCEIYDEYKKKYNSTTQNKFYNRMIYGFDNEVTINKMIDDFKNVTFNMMTNINFIHDDIQNYVKKCSKKYDVVQTSNVTDWLNTKEHIRKFIKNVDNICEFDGVTIWRSLNGGYHLFAMLLKHNDNIIPHKDLSHFYKSIYVVKKKLTLNNLMFDVKKHVNMENTIAHPYFFKLYYKIMDLGDFHKTQIPFYYAVQHWVIALQKLSDRLKSVGQIETDNILNENIHDELGIDTNITHVETFNNFLLAMDETNLQESKCIDEFNNYLDNMIEHKSLQYVFAYLGMIEYQYIFISTIIKDFVDFYGIRQNHYRNHEIMDVKHSTDLFKIAIHFTKDNFMDLKLGILDGYTNFMKLYEELSKVGFST